MYLSLQIFSHCHIPAMLEFTFPLQGATSTPSWAAGCEANLSTMEIVFNYVGHFLLCFPPHNLLTSLLHNNDLRTNTEVSTVLAGKFKLNINSCSGKIEAPNFSPNSSIVFPHTMVALRSPPMALATLPVEMELL